MDGITVQGGNSQVAAASAAAVPVAAAAVPADPAVASAAADGERARRWVFTINNPVAPYPRTLGRGMRYLVFQLEKGAQGTPHLQGYCEFERPKRLGGVTGCFEGDYREPQPRGHWEIARGTYEQCKAYCTKLGTREEGPWEFGEAGPGERARTDLRSAAAALLSSGKISDVPPDVFLKYGSNCLKLASRAAAPYRPELRIVCVCGPTGIGKSYGIRNRYPGCYCPYYGNCGLWWDGYCEQEVVLLEEFAGQIQLQKLLQLLDPYPAQVECKGGSVAARYKVVFIVSNRCPELWYDNPRRADGSGTRDKELEALYRRIGYGKYAGGNGYFIAEEGRSGLNEKLDEVCAQLPVQPVSSGLSGGEGSRPVPAPDPAPARAQAAQVPQVAEERRGNGGNAEAVHACCDMGDGCCKATACDRARDLEHLESCSGIEEVDGEYMVCHHPSHEFNFGQ